MRRLAFVLMLLPLPALAEYRAYQYLVKTNDPMVVATRAQPRYVISTLNPAMFRTYNGGDWLSVDLLRTWICPGYTGNRRPVCSHPYDEGVLR